MSTRAGLLLAGYPDKKNFEWPVPDMDIIYYEVSDEEKTNVQSFIKELFQSSYSDLASNGLHDLVELIFASLLRFLGNFMLKFPQHPVVTRTLSIARKYHISDENLKHWGERISKLSLDLIVVMLKGFFSGNDFTSRCDVSMASGDDTDYKTLIATMHEKILLENIELSKNLKEVKREVAFILKSNVTLQRDVAALHEKLDLVLDRLQPFDAAPTSSSPKKLKQTGSPRTTATPQSPQPTPARGSTNSQELMSTTTGAPTTLRQFNPYVISTINISIDECLDTLFAHNNMHSIPSDVPAQRRSDIKSFMSYLQSSMTTDATEFVAMIEPPPGPLKDAWLIRKKRAVLDVAIAMRKKVLPKAPKTIGAFVKEFKRILKNSPQQV